MNLTLVGLAALLAISLAAAHEGHGQSGAHWHASDLFGLLLAVCVGLLALRSRK